MKFSDKLGYLRYLVDKRGMKPVYLIIGLTYDCNSFCRTCFNWELLRKNKEHELSLDELTQTFSPPLMTTNSRSPRDENVCLSSSSESSCSLFLRSNSQLKHVRQNAVQP